MRNIIVLFIGVARIFDWGVARTAKLHAMTSSKIFKLRNFLWTRIPYHERSETRTCVWQVTRILLKGEDLNQNLKISFPKMSKLVGAVSKLVLRKRVTDGCLGEESPAAM